MSDSSVSPNNYSLASSRDNHYTPQQARTHVSLTISLRILSQSRGSCDFSKKTKRVERKRQESCAVSCFSRHRFRFLESFCIGVYYPRRRTRRKDGVLVGRIGNAIARAGYKGRYSESSFRARKEEDAYLKSDTLQCVLCCTK